MYRSEGFSGLHLAGSRHKDKCHWFVNGQELDAQSGHAGRGKHLTQKYA